MRLAACRLLPKVVANEFLELMTFLIQCLVLVMPKNSYSWNNQKFNPFRISELFFKVTKTCLNLNSVSIRLADAFESENIENRERRPRSLHVHVGAASDCEGDLVLRKR